MMHLQQQQQQQQMMMMRQQQMMAQQQGVMHGGAATPKMQQGMMMGGQIPQMQPQGFGAGGQQMMPGGGALRSTPNLRLAEDTMRRVTLSRTCDSNVSRSVHIGNDSSI